MLLSVVIGSGTQLLLTFVITLIFACLGFLSPGASHFCFLVLTRTATRGGMMTSMLVIWVMLGILAGYVSARLYKVRCFFWFSFPSLSLHQQIPLALANAQMFGGEQWKTNVLLASFLVPGIIFIIFFVLNLVSFYTGLPFSLPYFSHPQILWHLQSSAAVPFGTLLALVTLWFCVSVPLVRSWCLCFCQHPFLSH